MSLFVGDTGKTFRLNASFNMASYTELEMVFTKPSGATVTKATADGVSLGVVDVIDETLGTFSANEYANYSLEPGLINEAGVWSAYLKYTNTTPNPDHIYYGETVSFNVFNPGGC